MTRRLIREGDPPAGQLASPVPQYWNPNTEAFEDVLGAHGAPRAILYGPNGQPISQSNPLEVRVRELEAELAAMRGMLETGDAKVQLKGRLPQPEAPIPIDVRSRNIQVKRVTTNLAPIEPNESKSLLIKPSTGTVGRIQTLAVDFRPSNATEGNLRVTIRNGSPQYYISNIVQITSAGPTNNLFLMQTGHIIGNVSMWDVSANGPLWRFFRGFCVSEDSPLEILFENLTNNVVSSIALCYYTIVEEV